MFFLIKLVCSMPEELKMAPAHTETVKNKLPPTCCSTGQIDRTLGFFRQMVVPKIQSKCQYKRTFTFIWLAPKNTIQFRTQLYNSYSKIPYFRYQHMQQLFRLWQLPIKIEKGSMHSMCSYLLTLAHTFSTS